MGFFDTARDMLGSVHGQNDDPKSKLFESIIGMLSNSAQNGGLQGMIAAFQQAGLGGIIQSWVGTGANSPISADQLQQALGGDRIAELAGKLGISPDSAATHLAEIMPELIDKLTPDGKLPENGFGNLGSMLSQFLPKI